MSAMCIGVTPSLPSHNPNASRMDKRPIQLTWTDKRNTRMARHNDKSTCNWDFGSLNIFSVGLNLVRVELNCSSNFDDYVYCTSNIDIGDGDSKLHTFNLTQSKYSYMRLRFY